MREESVYLIHLISTQYISISFLVEQNQQKKKKHRQRDVKKMESISQQPTDMCLSIRRLSNNNPDLVDMTGSSGTSPETAANEKKTI